MYPWPLPTTQVPKQWKLDSALHTRLKHTSLENSALSKRSKDSPTEEPPQSPYVKFRDRSHHIVHMFRTLCQLFSCLLLTQQKTLSFARYISIVSFLEDRGVKKWKKNCDIQEIKNYKEKTVLETIINNKIF